MIDSDCAAVCVVENNSCLKRSAGQNMPYGIGLLSDNRAVNPSFL